MGEFSYKPTDLTPLETEAGVEREVKLIHEAQTLRQGSANQTKAAICSATLRPNAT